RQRLRDLVGHVRQGRPERARVVGAADPPGGADDGRGHRRVSADNLLELAERIAGWARDGEQVEAYVARSHDTEVRVFDGDVESLSSAESEGVGVRVVVDGRQGFAYAGSLEAGVVDEVLAEARDNAGF